MLQNPNNRPEPNPTRAKSEAPLQLWGRVDSPTRPSELRRRQDPAGPCRSVGELLGATIQDDSTQLCRAELHPDQVPAPRQDPRLATRLSRVRVRGLTENPGLFV